MRALVLGAALWAMIAVAAASDYRLDLGTSMRGSTLRVEPRVSGPAGSVLRYELEVRRHGRGKSADSSQAGTVRLDDQGKGQLATNAVNVAPGDSYEVEARLFDKGRLVAQQSARHP
jgi:hypothetical protein